MNLNSLKYVYENHRNYGPHFHLVHDEYTRLRSREVESLTPKLVKAFEEETGLRAMEDSAGEYYFRLNEKLDPKGGDGLWNTVAFRIRVSFFPYGAGMRQSLHIFPYAWDKDNVEAILSKIGMVPVV